MNNKVKAEESFWKSTETAGSYTMYKKYMKSYPKGKYFSKAVEGIKKTKIKWEFKDQREESSGTYSYKVKLSDVENAKLGSFDPNMLEASLSRNTVSVLIKTPGKQALDVSDNYGRRTTIEMNPKFKILQALFTDGGDVINYEIWGGEAPYFLRIVDAETDKWVCDNQKVEKSGSEARATGTINKMVWATEICNLNGTYKFEVQDRRKNTTVYPQEQFAFEGKSNAGTYMVLLSLLLLPLIAGALWFVNQKKKEKESKEYFEKHRQQKSKKKEQKQQPAQKEQKPAKKESKPAAPPPPKPKEVVEVAEVEEEPVESFSVPQELIEDQAKNVPEKVENELADAAAASLPMATNGDKKPKISVKRKEQQQQQVVVNDANDYNRIALERIWEDSAISEVCISKDSILAIDEFIRKENRQGIDEDNNAVPEVGGFLLGNHIFEEAEGQYKIFLEKFVPITPEQNDVYKVEFGVEAWVELDNVKDQYPDLMLLGWFHTHPGHSLFLSQPDLKIHEGFFKQNFQVAMEIDTLSENLDTGFFVRRKDGTINNTRDLKEGEEWYSWIEIEKFLRKKKV